MVAPADPVSAKGWTVSVAIRSASGASGRMRLSGSCGRIDPGVLGPYQVAGLDIHELQSEHLPRNADDQRWAGDGRRRGCARAGHPGGDAALVGGDADEADEHGDQRRRGGDHRPPSSAGSPVLGSRLGVDVGDHRRRGGFVLVTIGGGGGGRPVVPAGRIAPDSAVERPGRDVGLLGDGLEGRSDERADPAAGRASGRSWWSGFVISQLLFEGVQGAVHEGLHGPVRAAHEVGDLGDGQVEPVAEDDRQPLALGEQAHGLPDPAELGWDVGFGLTVRSPRVASGRGDRRRPGGEASCGTRSRP